MIEAPSVTVNKKNNPGITWFEIDEATQKPTGLKYQFMNLDPSYNLTDAPAYKDMEFWEVNMETQYGLTDLSGAGLNAFQEQLKANVTLTQDWMVRKIGFRPNITAEYDKAMGIYSGKKLQLVANTTDP
jgi:hypothetical protein